VLEEFVGPTDIYQLGKSHLRYNGTELSRRGGNTMACRTITRGEHFSWYNKCSGIRTKVLEEVREAVQEHKAFCGGRSGCKLIEAKACTRI